VLKYAKSRKNKKRKGAVRFKPEISIEEGLNNVKRNYLNVYT